MGHPMPPEARAERIAYVAQQRAAGVPWADIGRNLGIHTETIRAWFSTATGKVKPRENYQKPAMEAKTAPRVQRTCLGPYCGARFGSTGPGHRLCDLCTSNAANMSIYAPDPGGDTGRRAGRPR